MQRNQTGVTISRTAYLFTAICFAVTNHLSRCGAIESGIHREINDGGYQARKSAGLIRLILSTRVGPRTNGDHPICASAGGVCSDSTDALDDCKK
jgi:hypothetical protein